jgi:hypothetical protein
MLGVAGSCGTVTGEIGSMILSDRREFVFIHNPKCGGTSVREELMQFDTTSDFFWMYDDLNGATIDKAHLPLFIFKKKYPEYFQLLDKYFTFIFVRNPYARIVSGFIQNNLELIEAPFTPEREQVYRQRLNDFIRDMSHRSLTGLQIEFRHFVRQIDLVYIGKKSFVDLVMKLEEWPKCLVKLRSFLPDVADLLENAEKRNVNAVVRDAMNDLTPESIKKINILYRSDFDVFGYDML